MSLISSPIPPRPQTFTTADGTIQGVMDGVNTAFTIGVYCRRAQVFWNGLAMALNHDVAFGGTGLVFINGNIPQAGDVISLQGWV